MNAKKYILSLLACLIASCAPTVVKPSPSIPTPIAEAQSVKPTVEKIQGSVDKVVEDNQELKATTKEQSQVILTQKVKIAEAIAQSKRIEDKAKAKELISEIEALELTTNLQEVSKENEKLEIKNVEFGKSVARQGEELYILRMEARQAMQEIEAKENEASSLRKDNTQLAKDLTARNVDVEKMQKQVIKSETAAAKANVYKHWIWGICGLFALWTIIKNVLMVYLPTTKFRI
jgi:hypothetical protein